MHRILLATRTDDVVVKVGSKCADEDETLGHQNHQRTDFFRNEREAMLRLRGHPHVAQVLDTSAQTIELAGHRYHALTLEVAQHGDILRYVHLQHFDEVLARTYFVQLMLALKAAHTVGVYHRDVKLENLLLCSTFNLKLADFGLAHVSAASSNLNPPRTGTNANVNASFPPHLVKPISESMIKGYCGSPGYVAPEVSKDSFYLGSAADVWSAGCVLFAMLIGHAAFEQRNPAIRRDDPWLRFVAEGKYDLFWSGHMRFCRIEVSGPVKGMTTTHPKSG
jgi:serine/threonine-protein kinase GIN4